MNEEMTDDTKPLRPINKDLKTKRTHCAWSRLIPKGESGDLGNISVEGRSESPSSYLPLIV